MKNSPPLFVRIMAGCFFVLIAAAAGTGCGAKSSGAGAGVHDTDFDNNFRRMVFAGQKDSATRAAFSYMPANGSNAAVQAFARSMNECADSLFHWKTKQERDSGLLLLKKILPYYPILSADSAGATILFRTLWQLDRKCFGGRFDPEACTYLERVPALVNKYPWLQKEFDPFVYLNLAMQYNIAGDLTKSSSYYYRFYQEGLQAAPINQKIVSIAASNYAIALNERGLADSTLDLSESVIHLPGITTARRTNILVNMAEAWRIKKDYGKALSLSNKAMDSLATIEEDRGSAVYSVFLNRAVIERDMGLYEQSKKTCFALLDSQLYYNNYRNRSTGKLLLLTGHIYTQTQQPDSALWYYHQALYTVAQTDSANINSLPAVKDLYAENTLMDALDGMANAWDAKFAATGNRNFSQKALQCRQLAFGTEKKLLETFTYDEAMSSLLRESKHRSKKALLNCYTLWKTGGEAQWVEQAIQVAEKSKAIVLLHSVRRNRAAVGNDADSLLQQLQQLRYQEIALQAELSHGTTANKDSLLQRQQDIGQRYLALESILKEQHPELKRSGTDSAQLTLDNLSVRLLAPGTCLLEFFEADSVTCVIWAGANGEKGIYLPGREVQAYTARYAASLQTPDVFLRDSAAFYQTGLRCSQLLLPPAVITGLQNGLYNHIIAIPDGRVSLLPFEAMVLPGPDGANRFLIEYGTVNNGYSVSTLLANLQDGQQAYSGALAVFTPFSKSGNQGLPRLAFTNNEAMAVQKRFANSTRYDDTQAGIESFRNAIKETGIIHIASHAKAMDSQPPRIFLYNSIITMPELYAASTKAGLVVLSACQTGAGNIDINEGPLSLSRAFYYAGARNVINSLWQVQDDATANIFEYFYEKFPAQTVTVALREAKLHYLYGQDASHRAPYYWAGLVHTGYETTMKQTGSKKLWWVALITAFAAIAALLYYKRRRNRQ